MVDGEPVSVEDGEAWLEVEMRTGRDDDPNIYNEFTDSGKEFPVSRDRYEKVLRYREGSRETRRGKKTTSRGATRGDARRRSGDRRSECGQSFG